MTRGRIALAAAALAIALHLLPLPQRGLVGPDEPRYASIARHMAESGDWVTPTLWGEAWFEKPAMLFWLGGAGHAIGLENFTRFPVAVLCLAFLGFLYWRVRESFGSSAAATATAMLATSAGWVGYADAGVFDAPLTVFTSAALLCLLPWASGRAGAGRAWIPGFGALLGLGVLSKGLVAPAVALFAVTPVVLRDPRRILDLLGPRALGPFLAVCLPWYLACFLRNGQSFVDEFLVRHHLERFVSSSLQHVQPWWFFLPVLGTFLLPWTPLLGSLRPASLWRVPEQRFLACWAFGTLAFFSISVNKLPAYILPVLPPLVILVSIHWSARPSRRLLLAAACSLALVPLAGTLLPAGLADGITQAVRTLGTDGLLRSALAGGALAAVAGFAALKPRGCRPVPAVAATAAIALSLLKFQAYPAVSLAAGTREFLADNAAAVGEACIGEVRRHTGYGVRHYTRDSVPDCSSEPRPLRIEGDPPKLVRATERPSATGRDAR